MTDSIGRADYTLGTDISGVKAGVAEAEAEILKSGARTEAATKSRAERLGNVIGTGIKTVATVSTALFAIASKGAIELQNVTADFTAETGLAGAAADRAGKAINEMSGRNIQGIKEIGGALTKVHTDLGLTGDEAEVTTERFLKFARATKQDAAGAVLAFDDILDAWGLTADHAGEIMDKLIVSHQKYGGSIEGNQRALAALAPQLKALNLSLDDGIGLLNLFASSGLDAAGAQKALTSAITKLPSGENLKQFLERLSKVKDDGERAKLAMEVFGTKAGAGLANAIRPGVASLDAFTISTEEATGATKDAAAALDSTFSSQVQLKIKEVGAAIRDLGPGITGVASALGLVGSIGDALGLDETLKKAVPALIKGARAAGVEAGGALADGLQSVWSGAGGTVIGNNISNRIENIFGAGETVVGKAWRKVIGSGPAKAAAGAAGAAGGLIYGVAAGATEKLVGPIMGAWAAVGGSGAILAEARAAGTLAGGAYGVAFSAAVVVGAAAIASQIQGPINKAGRDLHDVIFSKDGPLGFLKEPLEGVGQWLDSLPWPLGPVGAPDWAGGQSQVDAALEGITVSAGKMADDLYQSATAAENGAAAYAGGIARGVNRGRPEVAASVASMKTLMLKNIAAADPAIQASLHRQGLRAMGAIAQGIGDGRAKVTDAFDVLTQLLKNPMSRTAEVAKRLGQLTSKELAAGLKSNDPQVKAQAQYTKQLILDRLSELKASTATLTKDAAAAVAKGLKSKDPDIRAAALAIKNHVKAELDIAPQAKGWGAGIAAEWAKGLGSKTALATARGYAKALAAAAAENLHGNSPPPEGPLHTIDKGGENVGLAWAGGLLKSIGRVPAAMDALLKSSGSMLGASSLKFAPSFGAAAAMMPGAAGGGVVAGHTYRTEIGSIHITVTGVGSDVSPAAARRFSQQIGDGIAEILRDQTRRQMAGSRP